MSKSSRAWKSLERLVEENSKPEALQQNKAPQARCGHCGVPLNRATDDEGTRPNAGDLSVCWNCAGVNLFTDELQLTALTDAQVEAILEDADDRERLAEMRALIRATILGGRGKVDA